MNSSFNFKFTSERLVFTPGMTSPSNSSYHLKATGHGQYYRAPIPGGTPSYYRARGHVPLCTSQIGGISTDSYN